ncbi:MAG: hypothetical protein KBD76_04545 [Bacteriovorax sp.]|nr:hypothetical protein [Bacteriovorax sp.]
MKTSCAILFVCFFSFRIYAAEKVYQIEVSTVEERSLHGGLGPTNGPIGSITEFFEAELSSVPLVSIPGLHADKFSNKTIYIFKEKKVYLCPNDSYDKNCFECYECGMPEKQENLKKFDVASIGHIQKKVVKTLQFSSVSGPAIITGKEKNPPMLDFQFPQKGDHTLSLTAKHKDPYMLKNPHSYIENNTIYILKSVNDPDYYLCQQPQFSQSCFICTNCAEKLDKINSYVGGN